MGHVPAGPVLAAGQDHELPRRQHRGTGTRDRALASGQVARFGEALAATFLIERGAHLLARNLRVGRGEVDLLVRLDGVLVAVEVKTRVGADPRPGYSVEKADRVWGAARRLRPPARRVDLVTVTLSAAGADVRWIPAVR